VSSPAAPVYRHERVVRFQDVDAAGTIFYPRVLELFSDAYVAVLGAAGIDLPSHLERGSWVAPIVHAEADYLAPLRFGNAITVEIAALQVGRTSLKVEYRIRTGETVAASGRTVHVVVDRTTFAKIPVPDDVRARLLAIGATEA
jgi:YbgC/YbaW family acyl-CoA thioester hydrolase